MIITFQIVQYGDDTSVGNFQSCRCKLDANSDKTMREILEFAQKSIYPNSNVYKSFILVKAIRDILKNEAHPLDYRLKDYLKLYCWEIKGDIDCKMRVTIE